MRTNEFLLAVLCALPEHRVKGKKRLQKLTYLLKEAGAEFDADFRLKDFGPFSYDVADAAKMMTYFGEIDESEEEVGYANQLMTVYSLEGKPECKGIENLIKDNLLIVLEEIDKFSTLELEVAATVRFLESEGLDRDAAIERTKALKPTKSREEIIEKVPDILYFITNKNLDETRSENS